MINKRRKDLVWEYPEFPPRPIKRDVLFSLINISDEIYFVNASDEVLPSLTADSGGFVSDISIGNDSSIMYKNVEPGESVLLDKYDRILDSDFTLGLWIKIKSKTYGDLHINSKMGKGNVPSHVLMYKDTTSPKMVTIIKTN